MHIISSCAEMTALSKELRRAGKRIGFVPTMGALHQGHLSLVKAARQHSDVVVVSIFVNPTQFGPNEDFAKYPRTFDRDKEMLISEGTDYIFSPNAAEMYSEGSQTWVTVEQIGEKLDGRSRPGHFRGVTTVVSKLFHIVQPDAAFFGQKDAAQVANIRRMVRDLNFDLEIVVCPIVRESDGLAMSSRNAYLDPDQRRKATILFRSLSKIRETAEQGESDSKMLIHTGREVILEEPSVKLDYYEIVDPDTLDPVPNVSRGALVAVAAFAGTTRLIDNLLLPAKISS